MSDIIIAGLDGSLRNFGMTKMKYNLVTGKREVIGMKLIETSKDKTKSVRASSDNLIRAQEIAKGVREFLSDTIMCFAEVPSGGQDYNAVLGFGITIGIYAGVTIPLIEVSPAETKKETVGSRTASKQEMIEWAFEMYPDAPWCMTKRKGVMVPTLKNEHLADAAAIIHAGIVTPAFKQVKAILAQKISA